MASSPVGPKILRAVFACPKLQTVWDKHFIHAECGVSARKQLDQKRQPTDPNSLFARVWLDNLKRPLASPFEAARKDNTQFLEAMAEFKRDEFRKVLPQLANHAAEACSST